MNQENQNQNEYSFMMEVFRKVAYGTRFFELNEQEQNVFKNNITSFIDYLQNLPDEN